MAVVWRLRRNDPHSIHADPQGDHKLKLLRFLLDQQAAGGVAAAGGAAAEGGGDGGRQRHGVGKRRGGRRGGRPFLPLLPAWMGATDYWQAFLEELATARMARGLDRRRAGGRPQPVLPQLPPNCERGDGDGGAATGVLERRAGVFYLCPRQRYDFVHPEGTGHERAPFHAVWFCGGWPTDKARRRAMRALRPARRRGAVEVFRSASMLSKRGGGER